MSDRFDDIIAKGLEQIEADESVDSDIREIGKSIATRIMNCFGKHAIMEYIDDESGDTVPYTFVLIKDVDSKGTPLYDLQVSNMNKVMEVALNNQEPGCIPARYTPASYKAPIDGTQKNEDIVQTLVSTAVAKIKGRFKIEVLEDEGEVKVDINKK